MYSILKMGKDMFKKILCVSTGIRTKIRIATKLADHKNNIITLDVEKVIDELSKQLEN